MRAVQQCANFCECVGEVSGAPILTLPFVGFRDLRGKPALLPSAPPRKYTLRLRALSAVRLEGMSQFR